MTCDEVKPLLHARMDDEVDAMQRSAIDSHVTTCVSCKADVEVIESLRKAVREDMPYFAAPAHLRERVSAALRGARHLDRPARHVNWRVWGSVAAAFVVVLLGTAPFLWNERNHRQMAAEEVLSAHVRALMSHTMDVVSSDQHTVKPWFNGKVPFSPPVVDLAAEGFPLEGGRLDSVGAHEVAALVYRRRQHQIDVFVWQARAQVTPVAHFERDGYNEISWVEGDFAFSAISDLNAAELNAFVALLKHGR